jgi:hypothetical protein
MIKSIYKLFVLGLFTLSAVACFESKTENAAEDVGEAIEATAEDAEDTMEDAVEDVEEEMEEAADDSDY